jgi:alkyldihydroxyacetonephosphate synthase
MPYAREFLTPAGLINDTFETAITWDRFESFHDKVKAATERAILEATGLKGEVTCRFTHVYPDGPAPYFSFHALGRHGALLEQWQAIKNAASDALIEAGGTITHHHAVGRDHRPSNTTTWSRHSRRIEPIAFSQYPFCHGDRGAVGRSRMPIARSRRMKTSP